MANKIVLISNDRDFFDFIREKLSLRKCDEVFTFSFDKAIKNKEFIKKALLIINSESSNQKTLEIIKYFKNSPSVVLAYNEDLNYKNKCYKAGAFDYITMLTPDEEFQARLLPALSVISLLEKNDQYRDVLVKSNIVLEKNDVFLNYNYILDTEIERIKNVSQKAVFAAISPNEKEKFLIKSEEIEYIILNNIRKNDILMSYAENKYFLLLYDIDLISAQNLWNKIRQKFPQKLYAGFSIILNQKREQLISETLNKLHEAIIYGKDFVNTNSNPVSTLSTINGVNENCANFKIFRQNFEKKLEQVVAPVFYHMQQKYNNQLNGAIVDQKTGNGGGSFIIKTRNVNCCFQINSPGFSKIIVDICYKINSNIIDEKRISFNPDELDGNILEDLLEQFIIEYKKGVNNDA